MAVAGSSLVGLIAYTDVRALVTGTALIYKRRGGGRASPGIQGLVERAERAFAAGNWAEAARLCHQARAERGLMPDKVSGRCFELIGLANVELGNWKEARDYLRSAPSTPRVKAAMARCQAQIAARG